jgi:hypothetical protein
MQMSAAADAEVVMLAETRRARTDAAQPIRTGALKAPPGGRGSG